MTTIIEHFQVERWWLELRSTGEIIAYPDHFTCEIKYPYHIFPNAACPGSRDLRRAVYALRDRNRGTQRLSLIYRISSYHAGKTQRTRILSWFERN